jgi:probable HAF family extracellular repeat protein
MTVSGLSKFCKAKGNCGLARSSSTSRLRHGKKGNTNLNQRKREIKMKTLPVILVTLMASLAIGLSTARGQISYSLEDLGVVKEMEHSEAAAINNQGNVAGTAYKGAETCAFHYSYKFMLDAGGLNSRAFGINSTNLVVGDTFTVVPMEPRSHAAMFKGGVAVDLGVLPGQVYGRANGVNTLGQVVGFSGRERDSLESHAFVWSSQTGMVDIGTLGGAYAQAYAINDAGYVTGASQTQGMGPMVTTHAFIYRLPSAPYRRYNPMRDLGVLGGLSSYGMAINSYNHVAGYSTITTADERVHAFLHDGAKMIDLGSLGGPGNRWGSDLSVALGVNSWDQVVGYTYLPVVGEMPIQQVAFLWSRDGYGAGKMVNLNKLVNVTGKNYLLVSATGINDNGQIVANAYDTQNGGVHAVLLTPVK